MTKFLPRGDNHLPKKFIGAQVTDQVYAEFSEAARASNRSRSGLIRHLIDHVDLILSAGDNHQNEREAK